MGPRKLGEEKHLPTLLGMEPQTVHSVANNKFKNVWKEAVVA